VAAPPGISGINPNGRSTRNPQGGILQSRVKSHGATHLGILGIRCRRNCEMSSDPVLASQS
jgi:hypothetical protein